MQGYFHTHQAATALLPFFIQWYKSGKQPTIKQDAVYFFYRTQLRSSHAAAPPVDHRFGPVRDVIYITANLTAPAQLRVTSGSRTTVVQLKAGSTDVDAPFGPGAPPTFVLTRGDKRISSWAAKDKILTSPRYNDYYYSTGVFVSTVLRINPTTRFASETVAK